MNPKTDLRGKERLDLFHNRAPGDIVAMTGLVRDLSRSYPGRFSITVSTPHPAVWKNNPYVTRRDPLNPGRYIRLDYGKYISESNRTPIHFLASWHKHFETKTGVHVPLTLPKPDLHLSEEEENSRLVKGRYWVMMAGGKLDFTTKHWLPSRYQTVVDMMARCGIPVVQAGSREKSSDNHPGNKHPSLDGVIDLVGKTDLRQFIRLIAHADGVIGPITAAMHIAAAFDKPCVVLAGGREHWYWEAYTNENPGFFEANGKVRVNHTYLHTMGGLPCCEKSACWMNKVSVQERDTHRKYCKLPVLVEGESKEIPKCLEMISPELVVESVLGYYAGGWLPPLQ